MPSRLCDQPAPARRDHERRAMREKRELGSWGLFRTVGDKQPFIA